ncbi:MAG: hypothetical protein ACQESF_01280 [Nanobdellota archaeon]
MRFITGLIIGGVIGYHVGVAFPDYDLRDKFSETEKYCRYEKAQKPEFIDYIKDKGYDLDKDNLSYKLDYSNLEKITK